MASILFLALSSLHLFVDDAQKALSLGMLYTVTHTLGKNLLGPNLLLSSITASPVKQVNKKSMSNNLSGQTYK
jgi:hypothetical protein